MEVGPHPVLLGLGQQCLPAGAGVWLPTLRKGQPAWETVLTTLGALYVQGVPVDWAGVDRDYRRKKVGLPTYPFQRQRYWALAPPRGPQKQLRSVSSEPPSGPLRGERVPCALPTFELRLGVRGLTFLGEHRVFGVAVAAAPVLMELAFGAAEALGRGPCVLEDLSVRAPLTLPDDGERTTQVILTPEPADGSVGVRIFSLDRDAENPGSAWTLHATGTLRPGHLSFR